MTNAVKGESAQGELNLPKGEHYKQQRIDGKGVAKETTPKEIQDAGDNWLGAKANLAQAKGKLDKFAESFLKVLDKSGKTSVVIFDTDANCKRRVNIKKGAERLSVTTAGIND